MDVRGAGAPGSGPEHDAVLTEIARRFTAVHSTPLHAGAGSTVYALGPRLAAKVVVFADEAARADFAHELDVHARLTAQLPNVVVALCEAHLGARAGWAVVARFEQTLHGAMVAAHAAGGAVGLARFHADWWRCIAADAGAIAGALRRAGVLHMDMRPDNVAALMVDGTLGLRVFDFGRAAATTPGGWVVGGCHELPCDDYDLVFFAHHYDAAYESITGAAPVPMAPPLVAPERRAAARQIFGARFGWQGM